MSVLPSFKNPPVVETVLGVQFDPLPSLRNAHLGLFWRSVGDPWTQTDELPPLEPQFEEFPPSWAAMGVQFKLTQSPACRLRIKNDAGTRMVQIQNGRLHLNWTGGGEYPRFANIKPEFDKILADLKQFIENESLGDFRPNQWEVTYVNHIPAGELWAEPADWANVFPGVSGAATKPSMVIMEAFGANRRFEIKPQRGRLHVEINSAKIRQTGADAIIAKLTARGAVSDDDGQDLEAGLNLGHEAIVTTFAEITSAEAHKAWGREA